MQKRGTFSLGAANRCDDVRGQGIAVMTLRPSLLRVGVFHSCSLLTSIQSCVPNETAMLAKRTIVMALAILQQRDVSVEGVRHA